MSRGRPTRSLRGRSRVVEVSESILRLGCRLRSPSLVALAWSLATGPVEHHAGDGARPDVDDPGRDGVSRRPRRLVVLPKAGGIEDFRDASDAAPPEDAVELVGLARDHVKVVFEALVGDATFPWLTDTDYRVGDETVVAAKQRYRDFLVGVVRRYSRWLRVAGIASSNLSFRAERELAAACVEAGVAFVALHKESIRSSEQRPYFTRAYSQLIGPFEGSAIGVYNVEERASILTSGIAPAERVRVVGCPRMDRLHRIREGRPDRRSPAEAPVVLFAVDVRAGAWTPYDGREQVTAPRWERLAAWTDEAFVAAARSMPERRFIIKVKIGREQQQLARLPESLPLNLSVVSSGIGTALLERAAVVVGFNSTVLLEALAVGVPTLVPWFGEAEAPGAEDWILDLAGAVRAVRTPEDLSGEIRDALERGPSRELTQSAVAALDRYVGNADGRASERAWSMLRATLRK